MWDELGIAACNDPKAIRRAYALRLKKLDPDRDLEVFTRLREALEWALAEAARAARPLASPSSPATPLRAEPEAAPEAAQSDLPVNPVSNESPADHKRRIIGRLHLENTAEVSAPAKITAPTLGRNQQFGAANRTDSVIFAGTLMPDWHEEVPADSALIEELDSALGQRAAVQAIELCLRAVSTGALSLQAAPLWLERVFAVAVEDQTVEPAVFREFARTLGWDKPVLDRPSSKLRERVLARLAAEDWLEQLGAVADKHGDVTRKQVRLARLMLGRIGRHWMPRIDRGALKSCLDAYHTHESWLRGRIDPAWARTLEQRWRRREIGVLLFYNVFMAAILLDGVTVFVREAAAGTLSTGLAAIGVALSALLIWLVRWLPTELLRLMRTSPPNPDKDFPDDREKRLPANFGDGPA